jgi:hypothetical protein
MNVAKSCYQISEHDEDLLLSYTLNAEIIRSQLALL